MNRFRTSWTIFRHSFAVVRQHKTLAIFPLFSMVTMFAMLTFFLVPLLFHVTIAETWHGLWSPVETLQALPDALHRSTEAIKAHKAGVKLSNHFLGLAGFYLASLFATTFLNVAFYSQIIQAMNGGRASVRRGFAVAVDRLPAIAAWTLLSGTLGLIVRRILGRVGFVGQWSAALLGVSWSVASVFVAPVIINEKQLRNPLDYLKTSASLIKRTWGEGLIGISGGALFGMLVSVLLGLLIGLTLPFGMALVALLGGNAYMPTLALAVVLVILAHICVMTAIAKVFHCGLYIYATEGVAPGTFSESDFKNAWTVKRRRS